LGNDASSRCPARAIGALPRVGQHYVARYRRYVDDRAKRESLRDRIAAECRRNRDADTLHLALAGMVIGDLSSGEHLGRKCFQGDPVRAAIALIRAQGPDRGHNHGGRASGECNGTGSDRARIASQPGIRHCAAGITRRRVDEHASGKERVGSTNSLVVAGPRAERHACHLERDRCGVRGRRWSCSALCWRGSWRGCMAGGGRNRVSSNAGGWRTVMSA